MVTEATIPPLDLLLVGGTVVDPSQGLHAKKDVGIARGGLRSSGPASRRPGPARSWTAPG